MSDLPETSCACTPTVLHMYNKFQVNWTKIKGGCQSEWKMKAHYSKSDLPLVINKLAIFHTVFEVRYSFWSKLLTKLMIWYKIKAISKPTQHVQIMKNIIFPFSQTQLKKKTNTLE